MIPEDERYFSFTGQIIPDRTSTWDIVDSDRRRTVSVTMDGRHESDELAVKHFRLLSDQVSSSTYRIELSPEGAITASHNVTTDDPTRCPRYPELDACLFPEGVTTIRRDELEELSRLSWNVDIVAYRSSDVVSRSHVFKYYWNWQDADRLWLEMNLWMLLPCHPNIVPFANVVVDELHGRVIGFTSVYIPDENLSDNKSRIFKLGWLKQLINLVDLLNLHHGVAHQDIAPRNLLVDALTDTIQLFDFNVAARIRPKALEKHRGEWYDDNKNDVKGVIFTIYEIITRDTSLRDDVSHDRQTLDRLPTTWVQHAETMLDSPVAEFQDMLQQWQEIRSRIQLDEHCFADAIEWPAKPQPPLKEELRTYASGKKSLVKVKIITERRQSLIASGEQVVEWERPP